MFLPNSRYIRSLPNISKKNHAIRKIGISTIVVKKGTVNGKSPVKREKTISLLSALASTISSVVRKRASGAHSLAALADVVADVVVAATDLAVDRSLVLGSADALEVRGLGGLAGGGVDVATLGEGDLAVVAGALAADLHFGAGELLLNGLVDARLEGWREVLGFFWMV